MRSRITAVAAPSLPPVTLVTSLARITIALSVLATSACVRTAESATNAADSTAVPVVAHTAALSTRAWSTTASGIVQANTTVDVAFEVPGKVVTVGPDEGQSVRAGQPIASLDPTEYRLAVDPEPHEIAIARWVGACCHKRQCGMECHPSDPLRAHWLSA